MGKSFNDRVEEVYRQRSLPFRELVELAGIDFKTGLKGANLSGCIFGNVDFSGVDLRGTKFIKAQFSECNFTDAKVDSGTDFEDAIFMEVNPADFAKNIQSTRAQTSLTPTVQQSLDYKPSFEHLLNCISNVGSWKLATGKLANGLSEINRLSVGKLNVRHLLAALQLYYAIPSGLSLVQSMDTVRKGTYRPVSANKIRKFLAEVATFQGKKLYELLTDIVLYCQDHSLAIEGVDRLEDYLDGFTDNEWLASNRTKLMIACINRTEETEKFALALIDKNENLDAQDDNGWTALMFACRCGQTRVALELVKREANLHAVNNEGWTALMFAVSYAQREAALALVEKGGNLDVQNNKKWTALMLACLYGQKKVAHALVARNVQLDVIGTLNEIEYTALGIARKQENRKMVNMLEKAGALELPVPKKK